MVLVLALPQPFPFDVGVEPSPVVSLIAEALGLVGWNTSLMDVDGDPFLL